MRMVMRKLALAAAAMLGLVGVAEAHPHIFIDAKAVLVFNDAGELTAIRNSWTFDEAFSVWQIQGLDTNGDGITSSEEMQELADENLKGLAQYGFYTSAGNNAASLPFASMDDAKFVFENNRSTLTFGIEPQAPYRIKDRLEIAIADPEYYVAITLNDGDVTLENAPPGCGLHLEPPREMSPELQERLFQLGPDVTKLPPDLETAVRGTQGAIVLDCSAEASAPAAATALDAVTQVAETKPAMPFGGEVGRVKGPCMRVGRPRRLFDQADARAGAGLGHPQRDQRIGQARAREQEVEAHARPSVRRAARGASPRRASIASTRSAARAAPPAAEISSIGRRSAAR